LEKLPNNEGDTISFPDSVGFRVALRESTVQSLG
jgi:hypothetical protein